MSNQITIKEIEEYFSGRKTKVEGFEIDCCSRVIDGEKFYQSHLSFLKANPGNERFIPYYNRLLKFYLHAKKTEKRKF